jgi:hypothetical protein
MPSDPRRDRIESARQIAADVREVSRNPIAARHASSIGSLCTAIECIAEALLMGPSLAEALLKDGPDAD